jgi:hypothetical protein
MPVLFVSFLILLFSPAHAGLESLSVKNLDLDYVQPFGKGQVEKASLGLSLYEGPYPIEVHRTPTALKLESAFFSLIWEKPIKFIHDMDRLLGKEMNLSLGHKKHSASAKHITASPQGQSEFKFDQVSVDCQGQSVAADTEIRLMDDCRENFDLIARRVDIPTDFFLHDILAQFPQMPSHNEAPADHLKIISRSGDFSLVFYVKYFFYAGLRAYGHMKYENDYKSVVIRVDQIRFGYLTVTKLLMRELQERVKHPAIKIDPPYIRIELSE